MVLNVLALGLFIGLLVAGLVIVTVGTCGRWILDTPRCAACGQRVSDGEFERSGRCPECGFDVAAPRGIAYFRRRMRFGLAAIGVGLALLSLIAPGVAASIQNSRLNLGPASPTSSLVESLRAGIDGNGYVALVEAERRASAGSLSASELEELVHAIVDWSKSTESTYLELNAETVIAAARVKGVSIDGPLRDLAEIMLSSPLAQMPSTVRDQGSRPPTLFFPFSESAGSLSRSLSAATVSVDGKPVAVTPNEPLRLALPPGEHEIEIRLHGTISLINGPLASTIVDTTLRHRLVVVPADAPPILPLFDDPSIEEVARRILDVRAVAIDLDSSTGRCIARVDIATNLPDSSSPPSPDSVPTSFVLSYDVVLAVEDEGGRKEYHAGARSVFIEKDGTSASAYGTAVMLPCPSSDARVEVILRPNPIAAEDTAALITQAPLYVRELVSSPRLVRNAIGTNRGAR